MLTVDQPGASYYVELDGAVASDDARLEAARAIADDIRRSIGLRRHCQAVPPGTLPRFELKAKRLVIRD